MTKQGTWQQDFLKSKVPKMAILYFYILSMNEFDQKSLMTAFLLRLGPYFFLSSSGYYEKKEKKVKAF